MQRSSRAQPSQKLVGADVREDAAKESHDSKTVSIGQELAAGGRAGLKSPYSKPIKSTSSRADSPGNEWVTMGMHQCQPKAASNVQCVCLPTARHYSGGAGALSSLYSKPTTSTSDESDLPGNQRVTMGLPQSQPKAAFKVQCIGLPTAPPQARHSPCGASALNLHSFDNPGEHRRPNPAHEIRNGAVAYSCSTSSIILRGSYSAPAPKARVSTVQDVLVDAEPFASTPGGAAARLFQELTTQGRPTETAAGGAAAGAASASKPSAATQATTNPTLRAIQARRLQALLDDGPAADAKDDADEDSEEDALMVPPASDPTASTQVKAAPFQELVTNGHDPADGGTDGKESPDSKPTSSTHVKTAPSLFWATTGQGLGLAPGTGAAAAVGVAGTKPPDSKASKSAQAKPDLPGQEPVAQGHVAAANAETKSQRKRILSSEPAP
jgi:hypothetical protein